MKGLQCQHTQLNTCCHPLLRETTSEKAVISGLVETTWARVWIHVPAQLPGWVTWANLHFLTD